MSRTPSSGIATAQTAVVSQPGFLIAITVDGYTIRMTTLDANFVYGEFSWATSDVTVESLGWDTGGALAGRLVLGDTDLAWWVFALDLKLQDAPVSIWQVYASATEEAEPLWSGRVGAVSRDDLTVVCDLVNDGSLLRSPRRRVQNVIPAMYLLPAGKEIKIGGPMGQKWILERKKNG